MGGFVQGEIGLLCGQEVGVMTSLMSVGPSNSTGFSHHAKGERYASPPWREDDKDGHYMFAVGDNLTSRCNFARSQLPIFSFRKAEFEF